MQHLLRELDSLSKQLASAKRDHETEAVKRADCENRIKTLQRELELQGQVHDKVQNCAAWSCSHLTDNGVFQCFDTVGCRDAPITHWPIIGAKQSADYRLIQKVPETGQKPAVHTV